MECQRSVPVSRKSTIIATKGIGLELKVDKFNFKQKFLNANMNVINELNDNLSQKLS